MEFGSSRDLERYMHEAKDILSLETKLFFLLQVSSALRFLRDSGVVHLDVKPQNILVKVMRTSSCRVGSMILKMIDFG